MPEQNDLLRNIEGYKKPEDARAVAAIENIARTIIGTCVAVKPEDKVLIWFEDGGIPLVRELCKQTSGLVAKVNFFQRDIDEDVRVFGNLESEEEQTQFFKSQKDLIDDADVIIIVAATKPGAMDKLSQDKRTKYFKLFGETHKNRLDPKQGKRWTLIRWPIEAEAEREHLAYDEYFNLFLEACDQDWGKIKKAQDLLIEKLDKGKKLRICANENSSDPNKRTDLRMSIEGMTFGNSTIDVNFPGSEVFSAPVANSVNGQLYAPGEFMFQGEIIKNIFLKFKGGKIIEAHADGIKDLIKEKLKPEINGEGVLYLGEVALGTNPGLIRKLINTLLCEKVGGSFHIAVGHCYEYAEFAGKKVEVNNGNTSDKTKIHWDIAVLMHPSCGGGRVTLDGKKLSINGVFKDKRLAILNPKGI